MGEIYFILESMGLDLNVYEDGEEIKQLLNKLGRPELKNLIDNLKNNNQDSEYEYLSESESESEEDNDIVNENLEIHLSKDGFYKIN